MEEVWIADRSKLRELLVTQPELKTRDLVARTGRSERWVRKWRQRLAQTSPSDWQALQRRSSRPHRLRPAVDERVVEAILALRDELPARLHRVAGAPTILYYIHQDKALHGLGVRLPTSRSTVWKILDRAKRIARRAARPHEPLPLVGPMTSWELDFTDVPSVPATPGGKQQHVVEALNGVDCGTSLVVESFAGDDYTAETTLLAVRDLLVAHGLPPQLRFDRDPRLVGSAASDLFPSALVRFLLCLDIDVDICPPHQPQDKPYVERFNRTLKAECLRPAHPKTLADTQAAIQGFQNLYNHERPHQGRACANQPPRVAFPTLPALPPPPPTVDPDRWLAHFHHRPFTRRVSPAGSIKLGKHTYYLSRQWQGRLVTVYLDAPQHVFHIQLAGQRVKTLSIKGLVGHELSFEDFTERLALEARSAWKAWQRRQVRYVT